MATNTNECTDGYEKISSIDECVDAADYLHWSKMPYEYLASNDLPHLPGGCYLKNGQVDLFFNKHSSGGSPQSSFQPVCKMAPAPPPTTGPTTSPTTMPSTMPTSLPTSPTTSPGTARRVAHVLAANRMRSNVLLRGKVHSGESHSLYKLLTVSGNYFPVFSGRLRIRRERS